MWNPTHLQVTVHKAKDLIAKGKNGTNDAYVTIQLAKEKFQTSVLDRTTHPQWDEECDLPIPKKKTPTSASPDLKLAVYNRSLIGIDNFLGQLVLPLDELPVYDRSKNKWYPLRGKTDSKKPVKDRGMIEVRIEFSVQNTSAGQQDKKSTMSNRKLSTSSNQLSGSTLSLGTGKRKLSIKSFASNVGDKLNLKSRSKFGSKNDVSGSHESLNKKSPFNLRKQSLADSPVYEGDGDADDNADVQLRGRSCRERNSANLSKNKKPIAQSMLDLRSGKVVDFPKIGKRRDSKVIEVGGDFDDSILDLDDDDDDEIDAGFAAAAVHPRQQLQEQLQHQEHLQTPAAANEKSLFGRDIFGRIKRPNSITCSDSPDLNSLHEEINKEYFSSDIEQTRNSSSTPSPSALSRRLKASNQSLNGSLCSSRGAHGSRPSSTLFDASPESTLSRGAAPNNAPNHGVLVHSVTRSSSQTSNKAVVDVKRSSCIYGNSQIDSWADSDLYRHDDDDNKSSSPRRRQFIESVNNPAADAASDPSEDIYAEDFSKMSRQELEQLARKQSLALRQRDKTIDHLDGYIDNIVARAMESAPYLLQYPFSNEQNTICDTLKNNELNKLPPPPPPPSPAPAKCTCTPNQHNTD